MIPVLTFDNFTGDAAAIRERVIACGFGTETGPDGALYTGISQYPVPRWFDRIAELVGGPIIPRLSCFRVNFAGEVPPVWVHSDGICAQFASVLYLNLPAQCQGGTAFWRHSALRMDRLPTDAELCGRGMNPEAFHPFIEREWKVLESWERVGFVEMRWNRFITYPTSYFHSRFPFEGFGSAPEDGRLIWVCFFDKKTAEA
jgi:hypothetical protein